MANDIFGMFLHFVEPDVFKDAHLSYAIGRSYLFTWAQ